MDTLTSPTSFLKIESVTKNIPTKKTLCADGFTDDSIKHLS